MKSEISKQIKLLFSWRKFALRQNLLLSEKKIALYYYEILCFESLAYCVDERLGILSFICLPLINKIFL